MMVCMKIYRGLFFFFVAFPRADDDVELIELTKLISTSDTNAVWRAKGSQ